MAEWDERPLSLRTVQMQLARERLREDRSQRCLVVVDSQGSQGRIDCKPEGKLPMVVAVHGHSDGEAEEGDLPCEVAVACRKHQVHIRDEVGNSSGARRLGVQSAGNKDHSEGE